MAGVTHLTLLIILAGPILLAFPPTVEAANILFFLGFGSASHRLSIQPLAKALAAKNHNVTFLLQENYKGDSDSTVQYYIPPNLGGFFERLRNGSDGGGGVNFYQMRMSSIGIVRTLYTQSFGIRICENLYTDPQFLRWMNTVPKFDVVIMDALFNECGYGLAHVHGAKTMIFSISTLLPWWLEGIGMPDESSFVPDVMLSIPADMGFTDRLITAVMPVFWRTFRQWIYLPTLEKITREGLQTENIPFTPSFAELERNTSLVLVNTYAAQEFPRAFPPNVIPVGGMSWVEKRKPLPQKMEDFISEGKEGFIYISFGSFIDFLTFPEEVQETFIRALKQFPNMQFIWKLNKTPKDLPKHILVEKWMPQQDLLLHPKIRAFVTHSGIGGVNEAIYSSVPLICFPLMSEQDYNAQLVDKKGFGIKMEITALKEEELANAIRKMITDNSYKEAAIRVNKQFLDRPMTPLETAVWWTEYVLRQESTEFLRSNYVDQSWWKKRQLDVWLFVLLLTLSITSFSLYVTFKIFRFCFGGRKSSSTVKQKQN